MQKSKLSKQLRLELKKLTEMETRVTEQHKRTWDMIVKHGVDNDIQMLYEITDNIPSSYLRFTVFERIHELDPEKQVERVGRELSQELSTEVQKYAELFQKREAQVQHIENIAAREGVFDDAEKLGEAADRIPHTYLQRSFWDRYNALTNRYGATRKKNCEPRQEEMNE